MNTSTCPTTRSALTAALLIAAVAPEARAQQWSALDRVPRPYNVMAIDSSMTMALNPAGGWAPGLLANNRLRRAKELLTGFGQPSEEYGAMFLFRNQFAFGGFSYSGSIEAHIKDGTGSLPHLGSIPNTLVAPIWDNRQTSYANTRAMIDGLGVDYCLTTGKNAYNCLEQRLPGGGTGPQCITALCVQDQPVIEHLTQNPIPGLSLPTLPNPPFFSATSTVYPSSWPDFTFPCDNRDPTGYPDSPTTAPLPVGCPRTSSSVPYDPSCPAVNIPYEIAHELGGAYYSWPRFDDTDSDGIVDVDTSIVSRDICTPLRRAYDNIQLKLNACRINPPTLVPAFNCSPGTLTGSLCAAGSPFSGGAITPISTPPTTIPPTCVCNASGPNCVSGGGNDECGNPMYFRFRQQAGICHSHDDTKIPASTVATVPGDDNALADPARHTPGANPDRFCRSSVLTMVTDALDAHPLGVASTSPRNARFYFADYSVPQNNVVTVGGNLSMGNAIQSVIRGVAPPGVTAIDGDAGGAVDAVRARFARDLNRSLKGVYAAAPPTLSQYQDRAAFMVMEVPGTASNGHLDYLGRPMRLEWWRIDPLTGQPQGSAPLFSTDEAARTVLGATPTGVRTYIGPAGNWRNGTPIDRLIGANTLDRDGDGTPDTHPPVRWGYHLGGEGSRPVIVGAPLDMPEGSDRAAFANWKRNPTIYRRDRVAYALSNGYLHAYRVGRASAASAPIPDPASPYAFAAQLPGQDIGVNYDDNPAIVGMGSEIFRYRPAFVEAGGNESSRPIAGTPRYNFNNVVQQPLIERGQMYVRDVQLTRSPNRFATVLVMSQGAGGRGLAAIDISNPNAPAPLWDGPRMAAGALALAAPTIYMWPNPTGGDPIPVVLAVGGALTPPPIGAPRVDTIYAYQLMTPGTMIAQMPLPLNAGRQRAWPNTPVCVDRDGAGRVDRCFVLAADGTLAELRVSATTGAFAAPTDITPAAGGGSPSPRGGGRVFNSGLTAYFTSNNQVALVFGSGDATRIERGDGTANSVFKVIANGRGAAASTGRVDQSCRPNATIVNGHFPLGPGMMLVSPPTVGKGVVAFSAYLPGATGCLDGQSYLYAFDFETCRNVLVPPGAALPNSKPPTIGSPAGAGLPSSPILVRRNGKLLTYSSAVPSGTGAVVTDVRTRGTTFEAVRPLFFRVRSSSR